MNKSVIRVYSSNDMRLTYGDFERIPLHIKAYTDASFKTNDDHWSQVGFVILLCDTQDRCHIFYLASKKCKRVVRSIIAVEKYAFMEEYDVQIFKSIHSNRIYIQDFRIIF